MSSTPHIVPPLRSVDPQRIGPLGANVSYEFDSGDDPTGIKTLNQIGSGKFAKVYRGRQCIDGHRVSDVAIKVLHDFASRSSERLFKEEIGLLKDLSAAAGVDVVKTIDVLSLGPMAMCGCGAIYHPACPNGCETLLQRWDNPKDDFPSLHCSKCEYDLPAQRVTERAREILRFPAKHCCHEGPTAEQGTILNFVDREAIVMELLDRTLGDFACGWRARNERLGLASPSGEIAMLGGQGPLAGQPVPRRVLARMRALWHQNRDEVIKGKVLLLEKLHVMVQLAEVVAWLHGSQRVVHKDLAPDNIMMATVAGGPPDSLPSRDVTAQVRALLDDMASHPRLRMKLIDFGLSDKDELSRSWYEEEVATGAFKGLFMSPEAHSRHTLLNFALKFEVGDGVRRFLIPRDLRSRLMEGDIISDTRDPMHNRDLVITRIEHVPHSEVVYAYFDGDPPRSLDNQQFYQVKRLGESHDVYSLGVLFYYILTEADTDAVESLRALVNSVQDAPCALTAEALARRYPSYIPRRDAIRQRFWQDDLMVLILRAMVRGQRESFVENRIQRGPEPAQRLLRETRRIYHELQREILSAPRVHTMSRIGLVTAGVAVLAGLLCGVAVGGSLSRSKDAGHRADLTVSAKKH